MNEETLKQFNEELKALLGKYNVALTVEEMPAQKRIVVVPNEMPKEQTQTGEQTTDEAEEQKASK